MTFFLRARACTYILLCAYWRKKKFFFFQDMLKDFLKNNASILIPSLPINHNVYSCSSPPPLLLIFNSRTSYFLVVDVTFSTHPVHALFFLIFFLMNPLWTELSFKCKISHIFNIILPYQNE